MARTRADVIAAVQATFPDGAVPHILELLDAYGVEAYERERERVQIAIVTLTEGDEGKLGYFIGAAKRDYRDVLFWAEYPEESKLDTPEKRRAFRQMFERLGIDIPDSLKE